MDDFNKEEMEQLVAVFRDQSLHILEEMSQDLLILEGKGESAESLARLRRGAHTIKGDATCIGLDGVTEVAHKIEDFMDAVIEGENRIEPRAVDLILHALDEIREALTADEVTDLGRETVAKILRSFDESVATQTQEEELPGTVAVEEAEDPEVGKRVVEQPAAVKTRREYVRVEVSKIDELLNLAGEMVIARSVINQIEPQLAGTLKQNEIVDQFGNASSQMGKLIGELHKSVLKMRMVTIDQVFKRFARPMRELAGERAKQVELEMEGGETELDRALVDLLYEPMLHLLRNAVDHGIETVEERLAAGKPEVAKIRLYAYHEGNQVVVEVSDDGRGINQEALKAKAVLQGLMSQKSADQLTDEEVFDLIFRQGFSTAQEITHISGRGVGMAAVKASIEQMRGTVSVKSDPATGTTFTLRMPLTLAIIRAMLFISAGQLFALPLLSIKEIARVDGSGVVLLDGFETYRLREEFVSLVRPGSVLGFDRRRGGSGQAMRKPSKHFFLIVLNVGAKKYGVVADDLIGDQELVIKPLDNHWVQNEALAGASVLGDGRVALIMDAEMMFRKVVRFERNRGIEKRVNAG
jgi:two-component system chemotaxis sensor kinase CheA